MVTNVKSRPFLGGLHPSLENVSLPWSTSETLIARGAWWLSWSPCRLTLRSVSWIRFLVTILCVFLLITVLSWYSLYPLVVYIWRPPQHMAWSLVRKLSFYLKKNLKKFYVNIESLRQIPHSGHPSISWPHPTLLNLANRSQINTNKGLYPHLSF